MPDTILGVAGGVDRKVGGFDQGSVLRVVVDPITSFECCHCPTLCGVIVYEEIIEFVLGKILNFVQVVAVHHE